MKNSIPRAPGDLSRPQQKLWREVLSEFVITDHASLRVLYVGLQALDRAEKCRRRIDKEGETVRDRFDQQKAHTLLLIERDSRSQFLLAVQRLNLDIETR